MKPILFNTEMVREILEGRKTVTRRLVKPQPLSVVNTLYRKDGTNIWRTHGADFWYEFRAPFVPGDILWVRETWNCLPIPEPLRGTSKTYWYKADGAEPEDKWRPSIHMPREAARIFLRVTSVRAERLQDINLDPPGPDNQVIKEGLHYLCDFIAVWGMTIKPANRPLYGWDANPWVWVIEFERINEDGAIGRCAE